MVLTSDKERVKSLIQDTLSLLCRNGLNFNKQFCIEALVGVTIDEDDVFLVNIKETVKSDKAIEEERLAEEAARLAEEVRQRQEEDRANTSSPSQSVSSTSYSVKHAQRKRQRDSAANESDTVDSDMFDSYSEPSEKRSFMEAGNVKRERLEQEDEDELVFVKEEPREDNSFQDQYGGHPGPSWNNPLPPVSQYNTQSSSHDMLQHPPLPPGAAGDMQYPQTQNSDRRQPLQNLKMRRVTVSGQTMFECPTCGKTLKHASSLKIHMNAHLGIYPYMCNVCNKGFKASSHLHGHMSVHTHKKDFKCQWCFKEYSYSYHLKEHQKLCPMNPQKLETSHSLVDDSIFQTQNADSFDSSISKL